MALSNSIDFAMTATELIRDARAELGIDAEEEPLEAAELMKGLRFLNAMLKAWQADGVEVWTFSLITFTLIQNDVDYLFGAGGTVTTVPMDFTDDVTITRSGTDLPMMRMSRDEYRAIPNKTSAGYPTQWYYERLRDTGMFYVWPAPDSALGTIKGTARRRIMDMDAGSDNFDVPQEWYKALRLGLANEMIGAYGKAGTPEGKRVETEAPKAYLSAKSFDVGEGESSITITPSPYRRR